MEMRPVVRLEGLRLAQAVVRADCALPPPSGHMSFDRIDRTVHGGSSTANAIAGASSPLVVCSSSGLLEGGWAACVGQVSYFSHRTSEIEETDNSLSKLPKRRALPQMSDEISEVGGKQCRGHRGLWFEDKPLGQEVVLNVHLPELPEIPPPGSPESKSGEGGQLRVALWVMRSYEGFGAFSANVEIAGGTRDAQQPREWVKLTGWHKDRTSIPEIAAIADLPLPDVRQAASRELLVTIRAPNGGARAASKVVVTSLTVSLL